MPAARAPGTSVSPNDLNGLCLVGREQAERYTLRAGFASGQQYLDTADREREYAGSRALQEVTSFDWSMGFLPEPQCTTATIF